MLLMEKRNVKKDYPFFTFRKIEEAELLEEIIEGYKIVLSKRPVGIPTLGEISDELYSLYIKGVDDIFDLKLSHIEHVMGYSGLEKTVKETPISPDDLELLVKSQIPQDATDLKYNFLKDIKTVLTDTLKLSFIDSMLTHDQLSNEDIKRGKYMTIHKYTLEVW